MKIQVKEPRLNLNGAGSRWPKSNSNWSTLIPRFVSDKRIQRKNPNPNPNVGRKLKRLWKNFGSQIFETSNLVKNGIEHWVDFIKMPKKRVRRVQKCVVDWKVENVDFLKYPFGGGSCQIHDSGPPLKIDSPLFTMGKEIGQESTWYLSLKFVEKDVGSKTQFIAAFLVLRHSPWAYVNVSFALHLIDSKADCILFTRHMTKVTFRQFKPKVNQTQSQHQDEGHGFLDFISLEDFCKFSSNSLQLRLELYLTSAIMLQPMECPLPRKLPKSINNNNNISSTLGNENEMIPTCDMIEIVGKTHSFYIPAKYFKGFPKLEQYLKEEEQEGSLGILSLTEYSDEAVETVLNFLKGQTQSQSQPQPQSKLSTCSSSSPSTSFSQTTLDQLEEILDICSTYDLYDLSRNSWIRFLSSQQLCLEHLPRMIVLLYKYKSKSREKSASEDKLRSEVSSIPSLKFVTNHLHSLLLTYMWELGTLNNLHYWANKEPAAFASLFIEEREPSRLRMSSFHSPFLVRSQTSPSFPRFTRRKRVEEEKTRKIDQFQHEFYALENMKMKLQMKTKTNMDDNNYKNNSNNSQPQSPSPSNDKFPPLFYNQLDGDEDKIDSDSDSDSVNNNNNNEEEEQDEEEEEEDDEEKLVVFIRERLHVDYQAQLHFIRGTHHEE